MVWTMVHSQVTSRETFLIGEFAKRVGTTKDTVRFYTRLGLLAAVERRAGSREYAAYEVPQIERYEFIEFCKELGFSLRDIREALREMDAGTFTDRRKKTLVETKIVEIEKKITELQAAHKKLRAALKSKNC